jgi:flagellar basal-body rod protein FlgG
MDPGLVTALSGALAQSKRVETISNNLANADTVAFKSQDLLFEESLMAAQHQDTRSDIPERPYKDSELLSRSGDEQRNVLYGSDYTNLRAGNFKQTHQALDIAIEGNGFLEVLSPNGVRLTRAGNLTLDAGGRLVNSDGFLVLGAGNPSQDPALRAITVGNGRVTIDREGNVYGGPDQGNANLGRLSIVQISDPKGLKKAGGNLYEVAPEAIARPLQAGAANRAPAAAGEEVARPNPLGSTMVPARVHQGMLESSNVNPVAEMTKLIEAHRLFDQNTRMLQTIGDAASRVSEVGKF